MNNTIRKLGVLSIFTFIAWFISACMYLGEVGFEIGYIAILVSFYLFEALILLIEISSNRRFRLFRRVPARYLQTRTEHHSHSENAYLEVSIGTHVNSATYHPGSYDAWDTHDDIYQTGYAKLCQKSSEKHSSRDIYYTYLGRTPKNGSAEEDFKKVYEKDKKLSKLGLTLWGTCPIWNTLTILMPFLCAQELDEFGNGNWTKVLIYIMHFTFFFCSLYQRRYSSLEDGVSDMYNEEEHRPVHMYILGIILEYFILRTVQNTTPTPHALNEIFNNIHTTFYNADVTQFEKLDFIYKLIPGLQPFAQNLILLSVFELIVYAIVMGIKKKI